MRQINSGVTVAWGVILACYTSPFIYLFFSFFFKPSVFTVTALVLEPGPRDKAGRPAGGHKPVKQVSVVSACGMVTGPQT